MRSLLAAGLVAALVFTPIAYCGYRWHVYVSEFDWKRIPAKFEASRESFGARGTSCHLLVFKMSKSALQGLRKQGLSFFPETMEANGIYYSNWTETPKPNYQYFPQCSGSGTGADLSSASSKRAMAELSDSLMNPGNYVSGPQEYMLIVDPETGHIIFGGND